MHFNWPKESTILHGRVHLQTQTKRLYSCCFLYLQTFTTALIPHLLSLQYECGSSAVVRSGDGKQLEEEGAVGSTVKDVPKTKDISEMKMLVSGLFFSSAVFKGSLYQNYTKKRKEKKKRHVMHKYKIISMHTSPNDPQRFRF